MMTNRTSERTDITRQVHNNQCYSQWIKRYQRICALTESWIKLWPTQLGITQRYQCKSRNNQTIYFKDGDIHESNLKIEILNFVILRQHSKRGNNTRHHSSSQKLQWNMSLIYNNQGKFFGKHIRKLMTRREPIQKLPQPPQPIAQQANTKTFPLYKARTK